MRSGARDDRQINFNTLISELFFDHQRIMEPPSTLPGKRVRKRSKRLSETESVGGEVEPARKRAKRGSESSGKNLQAGEGEPGRRRRTSRDKGSSAKVSKN